MQHETTGQTFHDSLKKYVFLYSHIGYYDTHVKSPSNFIETELVLFHCIFKLHSLCSLLFKE